LIRRGKTVADYLHADCFAVSIQEAEGPHGIPAQERGALDKHLNFARNLHIETRQLQGRDKAKALIDFARLNGITQIFLMRPRQNAWPHLFGRNLLQRVVQLASDMQLTIVAERRPTRKA